MSKGLVLFPFKLWEVKNTVSSYIYQISLFKLILIQAAFEFP